jgi:hypothetical protein
MEIPQNGPADQLDRIHGKAAKVIENLLDFDCGDPVENVKGRVIGVNLALALLKQSGWSASSKNVSIAALTSKVPSREELELLMERSPD